MKNKPLHEREPYARFTRIWKVAWEIRMAYQDYDECYRCRGVYDRAWARQDAKGKEPK